MTQKNWSENTVSGKKSSEPCSGFDCSVTSHGLFIMGTVGEILLGIIVPHPGGGVFSEKLDLGIIAPQFRRPWKKGGGLGKIG